VWIRNVSDVSDVSSRDHAPLHSPEDPSRREVVLDRSLLLAEEEWFEMASMKNPPFDRMYEQAVPHRGQGVSSRQLRYPTRHVEIWFRALGSDFD
jgi:hypothetical protein